MMGAPTLSALVSHLNICSTKSVKPKIWRDLHLSASVNRKLNTTPTHLKKVTENFFGIE